jgi:hypothetical protein
MNIYFSKTAVSVFSFKRVLFIYTACDLINGVYK